MKNNIKVYASLALIGVIFTSEISCKKFVEIPPAKNLISNNGVFSDSINASASITGIYSNGLNTITANSFLTGGVTIQFGLMADELVPNTSIQDDSKFFLNALNTNDNIIAANWQVIYKFIYQTNAIIEGVNASDLPISVKNKFLGESKFLRSFFYYTAINMFGDVPLVLTTDFYKNAITPRTSRDMAYKQLIDDLIEAGTLLDANYISQGKLRPNKFTALALLARIYLVYKRWDLAENVINDIINSGSYSLEGDLNKVFLSNSREAIWQLEVVRTGYGTPEGQTFIPSSTSQRPQYSINKSLLQEFESNDNRKLLWLSKNTVNVSGTPTDYYYPYKYKTSNRRSLSPAESYMVFRLGELYLIRAEARAEQGKLFGNNSAESDLNIIRNRAGLANTIANDKTKLLQAIYKERRIELFAEWGNRWSDLKRLGIADAVMSIETPLKGGTWQSSDQLYPIPFEEIKRNSFLIQNQGYN